MIDNVLTSGNKSGYVFAAAGTLANNGVNNGFESNAHPLTVGQTGQRAFCSDQSGVIRQDTTGALTSVAAGACAAVTSVLGN